MYNEPLIANFYKPGNCILLSQSSGPQSFHGKFLFDNDKKIAPPLSTTQCKYLDAHIAYYLFYILIKNKLKNVVLNIVSRFEQLTCSI